MQSCLFALRLLALIACGASPGLFAAPARAASQPRPPELKKLHILIILDTHSNLADGLRIDEKRLDALLFDTIPLERRGSLDVYTGKDVTRDKILNWVKTRRVTSDEGILVFYGGHGAIDKGKGHYFQLKNGPLLLRSDLRKALEASKPGLAVLLTDCCSMHCKLPPGSGVQPKGEGVEVTKTIPPTVSCLLFRSRGIVDITAATDSAAWGDIEQGGLFTHTLCNLLKKPVKEFDRTGEGFVTWERFFTRLKHDTQFTFGDWSKQMRARGETIDDAVQIPSAYSLGQPRASGVVQVADKDAKSHAVVSLENKTSKHLKFRTRWAPEPETAWQAGELKPGGQTVIFTPVEGPLGDAFELLIEFEGRKGTGRLTPRVWKGRGKPTFGDGELATIGSNK